MVDESLVSKRCGRQMSRIEVIGYTYQPMSLSEWNSSVILGMAVAMIVRSWELV